MFGTYFYHQRIRKAVAVFGSLFNNINVIRTNAAGDVISQVKVPLSYAPRRDFLARIDAMNDGEQAERQIAIKLPRMSFEILSMNYDPTRQLPKMNKCVTFPDNLDGKAQEIYTPVPYSIGFQLNVYAKSQDDALQIVEQILPYFTPQYTVTVKPLSDFDTKEDTPITLTGLTFSDDYEGLLEARRTIIYTLDFEMKLSLYKNVSTASSIITQANVNFYEIGQTDILSTVTVDAFSASGLSGTVAEDGTLTNNNFKVKYSPREITSLEISSEPINGTATTTLTSNTTTETGRITANGSWSYTPNPDWHGTDTFDIQANLTGGGSIRRTVTVVVSPPDRDTVDQSEFLDLSLGENFIDIFVATNDNFEADTVTYAIAAGGYPQHGSLSVTNTNTGEFKYIPDTGFSGEDSFVYRASPQGGKSEIGVVTIVVFDVGTNTMATEFGELMVLEQDDADIIQLEQ